MSNFTFGLDPEFMILNEGKLTSAIRYLPKIESSRKLIKDGSRFYHDNVLAEVAIKPANNKDQALFNTQKSLQNLAKIIKNSEFVLQAFATYPKSEIDCMEAKIVSCNPEWEAYSLQMLLPPDEDVEMIDGYYQFKHNNRTAGGHIHLGIWNLKNENIQSDLDVLHIVRMMDLFVGIPSLFLDKDKSSKLRRKIYGKAGTHRMPEHGVEYRTLSNFWLSSPDMFSLIYDLTDFVVDFVSQGHHKKFWHTDEKLLDEFDPSLAFSCTGYDAKCLQDCINDCDVKKAEKFMVFISHYLPEKILKQIDRLSNSESENPYDKWKLK